MVFVRHRFHGIFALLVIIIMNRSTVADIFIETEVPKNYEEKRLQIESYLKDNQNNEIFSTRHREDMEPVLGGSASSCQWVTKVIKPYVLYKDKKDSYKYFVVQTKDIEQKIKVTRCLVKGSSCYADFGLDQFGITTNCREKYERVKLYVLVEKKVVERYLDVPACCVCGFI